MTNISLMSFPEAQSLVIDILIVKGANKLVINIAKRLKTFLIKQIKLKGKRCTFSRLKKSITKKLRKLIKKSKNFLNFNYLTIR